MRKKQVVGTVLSVGLLAASLSTGGQAFAKGADEGKSLVKNVLSVEKYNQTIGAVEFKSGKLTKASSKSPKQVVFNYLTQDKKTYQYGKGDAARSFIVKKQVKDPQGNTVVKLQQKVNGVPVWNSEQAATVAKDGTMTVFSGSVIPHLEQKLQGQSKKGVSASKAVKIAQKQLGFVPKYEKKPSAELVVYTTSDQKAHYAYKVNLNFLSPKPGNYDYFVSATNGSVLHHFNSIDLVDGENAKGTGVGVLKDKVDLDLTSADGKFYLQDNTRGDGIFTYNANNSEDIPGTLWSGDKKDFTSKEDAAAVSAHNFAAKTFDYYKDTFKRNSYDNKGAALKNSVHYGSDYNNAFWNGSQMVYGDGDGKMFIPLSGAVDVVAHELTHAVTSTESNLTYEGESGALNESLSDIFGTLVEFKTSPDTANYEVGEAVYTPDQDGDALRSMSDPAKYGYPDDYTKRYKGSEDNGGVHKNSSIINKAAYLIAAGGKFNDVDVKGVGNDKLGAIFYKANTSYLTSSSNFSQARQAVVQAASDLYGADSQEVKTVNAAFDAVKVK
ncbi:Bacillolysin (neutral protease) [Fictibacillus macauensis ZFHKF-1]|uniref:Neutral metalloproteinase n=1 Tax=Fictibacillus macauensis ZFHKF-1 TaxID=1196324 RepID=I8ALL9_9BACL|nr:M4 family metallopeptidase [Fictibacillus macauensis]EIT86817.1 Bacillolysin (neutral protease) [Fictibacillus macauensis ZFHKF-1]